MKLYYAPLESVTGYPLRNAHNQYFSGIDKYFSPFISANESGRFTGREGRDIAPENNKAICLVPQLLGKNTDYIIEAVNTIQSLGYNEINLNLGCPSGTVCAKGKGAGMLRDTCELDRFFDRLFETLEAMGEAGRIKLSVKTRLGINDPMESRELSAVYKRYPISELIVHARVLKDMYRRPVSLEGFGIFYEEYDRELVYNGDINTVSDYERLIGLFPGLKAVMLGRGLVGNPALARELRGGEPLCREELRRYLEALLSNYMNEISGEKNILFKLKENWGYLISSFSGAEKYHKGIKKAASLMEYKAAARRVFAECALITEQ